MSTFKLLLIRYPSYTRIDKYEIYPILLYSNRQKDERDQTHVIFYKLYYIQSYSHRYKFIKFIKLILQMKFGFYL